MCQVKMFTQRKRLNSGIPDNNIIKNEAVIHHVPQASDLLLISFVEEPYRNILNAMSGGV